MPEGTVSPKRRLVISRQTHKGQYLAEPLDENTNLDLMLIQGGSFLMGSSPEEVDSRSSEKPQHEVTVKPFLMGRTPITQAQWRVVANYPQIERELKPEPSYFKGDKHPVEQVSWDDATEFCRRLTQKTGRTYRLPSEAQWEYACRAGTNTPFHFGETLSDELANYNASEIYGRGIEGNDRQGTTEVGSFPANYWGLYDMHGNVWEWCEDDWHDSYEDAPKDGSAWVEQDRANTYRVLRGGSWSSAPANCRSAVRSVVTRAPFYFNVGFRVSCEPPRTLPS